MHLRRRSSAASATLASRTKPTTPTTSRRSSSRLGLMCKRGEDYSALFLRAFYEVSERGKYEIPAPNLRVPGSGTLGGFRPNLTTSSQRQTGGSGERVSTNRSRPAARDVYNFSLRTTAQRLSEGAGSGNSSGRAGDDYF